MRPKLFVGLILTAMAASILATRSLHSSPANNIHHPRHAIVLDASQQPISSFFVGLPSDSRLIRALAVVHGQGSCQKATEPTALARVGRLFGILAVVHAAPPQVDCLGGSGQIPLCCTKPRMSICGCPGDFYYSADSGADCGFATITTVRACDGEDSCPCQASNSSCT